MRVALAQLNPCVGDLEGNVERCLDALRLAQRQGADIAVLPELVLPGCPPRDILYDATFIEAAGEALADLARRAQFGPLAVVGTVLPAKRPSPEHPGLLNAALLLQGGETRLIAAKRLLPAHDAFFEPRWFLPAPALPPIDLTGRRIGFLFSDDLCDEHRDEHPPAELLACGAELLVCMAASPYRRGILQQRLSSARRVSLPIAYVNLCGAQDELIFDGRSFVLGYDGDVVASLAAFAEEIKTVELGAGREEPAGQTSAIGKEELFRALVLGVSDFFRKNHLERAFLGLSGGVDSAVVACVAAEALGAERVTAVAIPSRYTDPRSTICARDLAAALGIGFEVVELEPLHRAAETLLGGLLKGGTPAENLQARLRMVILMAFVNHYGGLLLNTSNKTELALGYGTLYGDLAGTLCPLGDITKLEVVALARWIQARRQIIPPFILERPPSAELRPNQVDPFDYDRVAPEMERLVLEHRSDRTMRRTEHKRWQAGVILQVSDKSFGRGRLVPITRR